MPGKKAILLDASNYTSAHIHTRWPDGEISNPSDPRVLASTIRGLTRFIRELGPDEIVLAGDGGCRTRKDMFPTYKVREKKQHHGDERRVFLEFCKEYLPVQVVRIPGYEADDLMAYIADREALADNHVVIITTDKDLMQVHQAHPEHVSIYNHCQDEFRKLENPDVDYVKFKSITGDPSDGIPSVTGPVTALKLLRGEINADEWFDGGLTRSEKLPRREVYERNLKLIDLLGPHCPLKRPKLPELWQPITFSPRKLADALAIILQPDESHETRGRNTEEIDWICSAWSRWADSRDIKLQAMGVSTWATKAHAHTRK
jgi:hypothetical protein